MLKIALLASAIMTLSTGSASSADWAVRSTADVCKSSRGGFLGQLSGLGYTVIKKENLSSLSGPFAVCLRKNSNNAYSLWDVQAAQGWKSDGSFGGIGFCRTATRATDSSCSNPLP